jgi:D-3-phosphoglycerate dehydrogenase / 2-oxoglutarate reductase
MLKPSVLVSESRDFPQEAISLLEEQADMVLADLDRDELMARVKEADVLWVRLRNDIDRAILDAAERLRVIVSPTTGLDHIDVAEAQARGISIIALKGEKEFLESIRATAEHTIALMFALMRRIPAAVAHVADGGWDRDLFKGTELFRKTVGIVGLGRLGKIVAGYTLGMGAKVVATDTCLTGIPEKEVRMVELDELLKTSDVVSLHIDLSPSSKGLISRRELALMKPGSILVNTSRGALLDETALLEALKSRRLGGAALDVLSAERTDSLSRDPLVEYMRHNENLIVTPHIGGCTNESMEACEVFVARKLRSVMNAGLLDEPDAPENSAVTGEGM